MVLKFGETVPKLVIRGGGDGRYVATGELTGHLVYRKQSTLMAVGFDPTLCEVLGQPVPVLEGVGGGRRPADPTQFAVGEFGTLIYASGDANRFGNRRLAWIDEAGVFTDATSNEAGMGWHSFSPNNELVAVAAMMEDDENDSNLYILKRDRDLMRRLTSDTARDDFPIWTPDGEWIIFSSDRDGENSNIYRVRADFSGTVERLTTSEAGQDPMDISPDGKSLLFTQRVTEDNGKPDLYLAALNEAGLLEGESSLFAGGSSEQWGARFSPDGQWVAYISKEDGTSRIYVKSSSGDGAAVQVSTELGYHPRWSPTEKKLFFTTAVPVRHMFYVTYTDEGGRFKPSLPVSVFDLKVTGFLGPGFNVSADGKRFSVVADANLDEAGADPLVVLNWFEVLLEKAPLQMSDR